MLVIGNFPPLENAEQREAIQRKNLLLFGHGHLDRLDPLPPVFLYTYEELCPKKCNFLKSASNNLDSG